MEITHLCNTGNPLCTFSSCLYWCLCLVSSLWILISSQKVLKCPYDLSQRFLLQLLSGAYYLAFLSMPVKLKKLWCFLKPSIEPSYLGFKRCNPIIPFKSNYPSWLYETLGGGWKCKNLKQSWERCSVTTKVRNSKFIHTIKSGCSRASVPVSLYNRNSTKSRGETVSPTFCSAVSKVKDSI